MTGVEPGAVSAPFYRSGGMEFAAALDESGASPAVLLMARYLDDNGRPQAGALGQWSPVGEYTGMDLGIMEAYRGKGAGTAFVKYIMEQGLYTGPSIGYSPSGLRTMQNAHRAVVADALAEGKPVPAEVLADYPDLAPPADATDAEVAREIADDRSELAPDEMPDDPTAERLEALQPADKLRSRGYAIWAENILQPGRYLSDGYVVIDTEAAPDNATLKRIAARPQGRRAEQSSGQRTFDETVRDATKPLEVLGLDDDYLYLADAEDRLYLLDVRRAGLLKTATKWDSVRGISPMQAVAFYRGDTPVAVLMPMFRPEGGHAESTPTVAQLRKRLAEIAAEPAPEPVKKTPRASIGDMLAGAEPVEGLTQNRQQLGAASRRKSRPDVVNLRPVTFAGQEGFTDGYLIAVGEADKVPSDWADLAVIDAEHLIPPELGQPVYWLGYGETKNTAVGVLPDRTPAGADAASLGFLLRRYPGAEFLLNPAHDGPPIIVRHNGEIVGAVVRQKATALDVAKFGSEEDLHRAQEQVSDELSLRRLFPAGAGAHAHGKLSEEGLALYRKALDRYEAKYGEAPEDLRPEWVRPEPEPVPAPEPQAQPPARDYFADVVRAEEEAFAPDS
ncbi:MAG: hypothetical protein GX657_08040, partial [Chloroflexi bacterium]|nr:hypothetical protein [Chloroflexota bacterium]